MFCLASNRAIQNIHSIYLLECVLYLLGVCTDHWMKKGWPPRDDLARGRPGVMAPKILGWLRHWSWLVMV